MKYFQLFFTSLTILAQVAGAQVTSRIKGLVITKERLPNGHFNISKGSFYYDTRFKKLVIDISYPSKETWVSHDTLVYHIKGKRLSSRAATLMTPEATIFHIALTGQISSYGLKKSFYEIEKVEKEGDRVYVTWKPDSRIPSLGKVKLAQHKNRLEGVVFFDEKGVVLAKQFFRKYKNFNGIEFPEEVVFINIKGAKEYYQIMTYQNIVVNDFKTDALYNYPLPIR